MKDEICFYCKAHKENYFGMMHRPCHEEHGSIWARSNCPVCGRSFPHKKDYTPKTCGAFDCLHEAIRRGVSMKPNPDGVYKNGKIAGIKVVVDWCNDNFEPAVPMTLDYRKWHKQLEEWGL